MESRKMIERLILSGSRRRVCPVRHFAVYACKPPARPNICHCGTASRFASAKQKSPTLQQGSQNKKIKSNY
ncbi:hypothetical protein [Flavobacterium sp.]|uniref:hypothetical protein n=1 Tax=Flavobacterium sp. TaxID=239 RepID=UPI00260D4078|nr:hypothetical protein [Flavobacterium sp.]